MSAVTRGNYNTRHPVRPTLLTLNLTRAVRSRLLSSPRAVCVRRALQPAIPVQRGDRRTPTCRVTMNSRSRPSPRTLWSPNTRWGATSPTVSVRRGGGGGVAGMVGVTEGTRLEVCSPSVVARSPCCGGEEGESGAHVSRLPCASPASVHPRAPTCLPGPPCAGSPPDGLHVTGSGLSVLLQWGLPTTSSSGIFKSSSKFPPFLIWKD